MGFFIFYLLPDFSGNSWLMDKGLSIGSVLSTADASALFSVLGMQDFLKTADQCDIRSTLYNPNTNGWKSGVLQYLDLFFPTHLKYFIKTLPSF